MSTPDTSDERIVAPDELNERQEGLIEQVGAGSVTENEPDTTDQLLTLARLGHLDMDTDQEGEYVFTVPGKKKRSRSASK